MAKPDTWKLTLAEPDRYGREQVRTVNLTIDIRDFKDKAGFPYVLMAANPHLSVRDIQQVLVNVDERFERPVGWINQRFWLFRGRRAAGAKANADGLDSRAHAVMAENPKLSSRQMVDKLRKHRIPRSKDWVLRHRVTGY